MKQTVVVSAICGGLLVGSLFTSPARATVENGWPAGTRNVCRNADDSFVDFERGVEATEIESTVPAIEFTTTQGINWRYGDVRTGDYNVRPYGGAQYETNGNFFAWLGVAGDAGRITFTGGTASYVSVLVSTYSGVTVEAYDANGTFLATSGWASDNLNTRTMTRLTVEAPDIAYVVIHDTGNYWLMDDLCTDAGPVCKPLPGREVGEHDDRIDLVFVPNEDYGTAEDRSTWLPTFLAHVNTQIDDRLGGQAPVSGNLDKFNFYYTERQGRVSDAAQNCGENASLPDDLIEDCTFGDSFVVFHQEIFGDCASTNLRPTIYSAEGSTATPAQARSFIHETGHAVFGLADEYDGAPRCSTFYFQPAPHANIWSTEDACRTEVEAEGWEPDECQEFTSCQGGWWKLGTDPFIMQDGTFFGNGWGEPGGRRISWLLDQYPSATRAESTPGGRSVWLRLGMRGAELTPLAHGFVVDAAPDARPGAFDFAARVLSPRGGTLGEFGFDDPRRKLAEPDYPGPTLRDPAEFTLVIPYFPRGARIDIVESATGAIRTSVDISALIDPSAPENRPGIARAGSDQIAECVSGTGTVMLDGTASSDPDGDSVACRWMSPTCALDDPEACVTRATCPLGDQLIQLVVNDGTEDSAPDALVVTVRDTLAPELACPGVSRMECESARQAFVRVAPASATDACHGSAQLTNSYTASGPDASASYALGSTAVEFVATDASGNRASCSVDVLVVDTTPPVIEGGAATPSELWPPNHLMRDVVLDYSAADTCETARCTVGVRSSEPENGTGDGDAAPDSLVVDDHHLQLRAERAGTGPGRTYAAEITCRDPSGNAAVRTATVLVRHN